MPTLATTPRSTKVAALLLVLMATTSAMVETWLDVRAARDPREDVVSRSERRLEAVRSSLPARGQVGYVTYVEPGKVRRNDRTGEVDLTAQREFFLAQYGLAPLALVNSAAPEWLLGDFPDGSTAESARLERFRIVKDFGQGVLLLERRDR
jgi:hypothetical protein